MMHFHVLIALALVVANSPPTAADDWTTIDPSSNWGWWDGWGTSLAWWAKAFGWRDDLADIFFTSDWHPINGQWLPGLGLNIVRYNAGASSWNNVGGQSMEVSPSISGSRQMEGYWLDWYNSDPSSGSWNWWVDSNQRNMLWKARDRGANFFELFSNSPMWWMCYNHNPSGSDDGSSDNLQSWNYDQHAVYLATIAKFASDNWGFSFQSVEPFNEPSAGWWNGQSGTQEGCHFDSWTQSLVINNLRNELNNRGLWSTMISASDENTYDQAVTTWWDFAQFSTNAIPNIGRINVHGYQEGGGRRDVLSGLASDWSKGLWNSEYGDDDATGQRLVSNLILDFRWLHQTAWVYWQVLDGGGWGLIQADNNNGWIGPVNQKYFLLAQFTRHIRQGMQILDGGSDHTVAAYDWTHQKLVIVAVNWGGGQWINFDLSRFTQAGQNGALVPRWSTQIGSGEQYGSHSDTYMSGTRFWSWFGQGQVQTFEVYNVVI